MLLSIEYPCTMKNKLGDVIFRQDLVVDVAAGHTCWHIVSIRDEYNNSYDGPLYDACKEVLECDKTFCELVEAVVKEHRDGQRINEEYDARYGSD